MTSHFPRFTLYMGLAVLSLLVHNNALANLLIHPTRVDFQSTERSQKLTLANTSQVTTTYQLYWAEKLALEGGGYRDLAEEESEQYPIASKYLRFSPKQVTLRPNERQSVKLLLRRARNLPAGEYRSHLLFKALPPKSDATGDTTTTTMNINMVLNFAIPVAVRVGDYDAEVTLNNAIVQYDRVNNTGAVLLSMTREGVHSTYGDISAFWKPNNGPEYLLAKAAGHSLWTELDQYQHQLIWATDSFKPEDGQLRIYYKGAKQFSELEYINETIAYGSDKIIAPPTPGTQ